MIMIILIISGKGPQRSYYQELIDKNDWQHVQMITPWLAAEDYPKLLGTNF
jgi:beta-1,4-mannosyltransferase